VEVWTPLFTCVYLWWVKDSPLLLSIFSQHLFEHPNEAKGCHPQGWWFGCAFGKVFLGGPFFVEGLGLMGKRKPMEKIRNQIWEIMEFIIGGEILVWSVSPLKLRCWHSQLEDLENMIRREQGGDNPPYKLMFFFMLEGFLAESFVAMLAWGFNNIVWWVPPG